MKLCSTTLVPRQMSVKTTVIYHSISIRLAKIAVITPHACKDEEKEDQTYNTGGYIKGESNSDKPFLKLYRHLNVQLTYAVWALPSPTRRKLYSYESLHTIVYGS